MGKLWSSCRKEEEKNTRCYYRGQEIIALDNLLQEVIITNILQH